MLTFHEAPFLSYDLKSPKIKWALGKANLCKNHILSVMGVCTTSCFGSTGPPSGDADGNNDGKKSIYFIRHGEAAHNVGFQKHGESAYLSEEYINSPLTDNGINQAKRAREELRAELDGKEIKLIFTSPLQRTIETTLTIFDGDETPIIALEELRECSHLHPCNKREDKQLIVNKFPNLNVDRLTDTDEWYGSLFPEDRFEKLMGILKETKENPIAVVSHHDALTAIFKHINYPHSGGIRNCQIICVEINTEIAKLSVVSAAVI